MLFTILLIVLILAVVAYMLRGRFGF